MLLLFPDYLLDLFPAVFGRYHVLESQVEQDGVLFES
jgi:hypothetical protein